MLINMEIEDKQDLKKALDKVNRLLEMEAITEQEWMEESERLSSQYGHFLDENIEEENVEEDRTENDINDKLVNRVVE